jgi:2'-5' RNA ligase
MVDDAGSADYSWLDEQHEGGFDELVPAGPVVSVTCTPKGKCYNVAKDIIERLARHQNEDAVPEPHITLQGIYQCVLVEDIYDRVARVAAETHPFAVTVEGLGLLVSPNDPDLLHLHLHVEKSPELVNLYSRMKEELDELGLRTYPFSSEEWVPHLTLASGKWSRRDLRSLLLEVGPTLPVCVMPIDHIELNRLRADGEWRSVQRFDFAGVKTR